MDGMRNTAVYQGILKEGRAEGYSKGFSDGLAEARAMLLWHGQVDEARRILRRLGTQCLGPMDYDAVLKVDSLDDLNVLEPLIEKVHSVGNWDELLADIQPRE